MARIPRSRLISENEPGTYHVFSRTVRQTFLMGEDKTTGKSYEHRREKIRILETILSRLFAIDVIAFGFMQNHFHEILRCRPDLAQKLSDHEVALRYCLLNEQGMRLEVSREERTPKQKRRLKKKIEALMQDPERLHRARLSLSSISVYEQRLKSTIARIANREDQVTGPFFAGRFESIPILDANQLLTTMVYVDLNPIRAGLADTPETSKYTSAYERIQGARQRLKLEEVHREPGSGVTCDVKLNSDQLASIRELSESPEIRSVLDEWLSPIDERCENRTPSERESPFTPSASTAADFYHTSPNIAFEPLPTSQRQTVEAPCADNRQQMQAFGSGGSSGGSEDDLPQIWQLPPRASNKGCLPCSVSEYLNILDWAGRQIRSDKRGKIPADLPPILERLKIFDMEVWWTDVESYAKRLKNYFSRPVNQLVEAGLCLVRTATEVCALPDALM